MVMVTSPKRTGSLLHAPDVGRLWLLIALSLLTACSSQVSKSTGPRIGAEKKMMEAPKADVPLNNPDRIDDKDVLINPVIMVKPVPDAGACVTCNPEGGSYCGEIGDNCGGKLDCGGCATTGYSCGGRGIEHVCGGDPASGACELKKCEMDNGRYCGKVGDGCGGGEDP